MNTSLDHAPGPYVFKVVFQSTYDDHCLSPTALDARLAKFIVINTNHASVRFALLRCSCHAGCNSADYFYAPDRVEMDRMCGIYYPVQYYGGDHSKSQWFLNNVLVWNASAYYVVQLSNKSIGNDTVECRQEGVTKLQVVFIGRSK